jgi:succinoglycan biosynthesis protein ExoA
MENLNNPPFVTVIMPVYNEAQYIQRSLESVLAQTYPPQKMEVIISDGMSNDGTRDIVHQYQQKYSYIKIIDNPGKIVPTGLNCALKQSMGDIIIRVDGHCEIAPDYVSSCVQIIQKQQVDGVGGYIETIGENTLAQGIALAMSSKFGVGGSPFRTIENRTLLVDTIPFPAYTRSILDRAGPYDEELIRNQDDEYNYRIRELGGKLLLSAEIHSRYYSRSRFSSLWRQYFQYGLWKVRVLQKHPWQMQFRQFIPPIFVMSIITCFSLSLLFPFFILPFISIISVYLLADMIVSIIVSNKNGWRYFPVLSGAYPILHIGYGIGFIIGFFRFMKRWSRQHSTQLLERN